MIKPILFVLWAVALLASCANPADDNGKSVAPLIWSEVTVCPANNASEPVPDFGGADCEVMNLREVDPQGRLIWLRAIVPLEQTAGPNGESLALFVSGKMSSRVYLNGAIAGQNGTPALDAASEVAGQMDAVLYPSQSLFKIGENEVVVLASSHQGYLSLKSPVHNIGIAPAGLLAQQQLAASAPPLITLGIFMLGALYFAVMAILSASRFAFAMFSAMSFSAGGQLLSETLRGFIAYAYPIHDLRLIAIAAFSSAFGLFAALYVLRSFRAKHTPMIMLGMAGLSAILILAVQGYDYKALIGMTVPLASCLLATGYWAFQRRARAFEVFLMILAFVGSIFLFSAYFLDLVFFLLVALFLLLIFVDQARVLAEEARERRSEEARANRLEQALAQAGESAEADFVDVKGAGEMLRIATSDIVHCSGAGGYCELSLTDGRTILHTASLNEMEEALPATFLRIHRSHLVNVQFVQSLSRDPSGTGTLSLTKGSPLPVSRRIMPKVRKALS